VDQTPLPENGDSASDLLGVVSKMLAKNGHCCCNHLENNDLQHCRSSGLPAQKGGIEPAKLVDKIGTPENAASKLSGYPHFIPPGLTAHLNLYTKAGETCHPTMQAIFAKVSKFRLTETLIL
jgi:hypothetical protein